MKIHSLIMSDGTTIELEAELLATVSSKGVDDSAMRWTELALYKSSASTYACYQVGMTTQEGEENYYRVKIVHTIQEVVEEFGYGWLAKRLYEMAEITHAHLLDGEIPQGGFSYHELKNDKGPDIAFYGELLAKVASNRDNPMKKRWSELKLYKSNGGKFICQEVGCSSIEAEINRHSIYISDCEAGLIKAVGKKWLAQQLYLLAGLGTKDVD